jgi:hypothetical protein
VGTLSDVDVALEEICIQHAESYTRSAASPLLAGTTGAVDSISATARTRRRERERPKWNNQGKRKQKKRVVRYDIDDNDDDDNDPFVVGIRASVILPASTPLINPWRNCGQYASIERCLLLASMQRAFVTAQLQ